MDTIRETFFDINTEVLIDMYENIVKSHENKGFLNESSSHDFIHIIIENIDFNKENDEYLTDEEI